MKKFSICCLVLAVAVMFVPAAQAAKCITLTSFCDKIQHVSFGTGGQTGKMTIGLWAWTCNPGGLGTLISGKEGGAFGKTILATQPTAGGVPFGAQAHWSLNNGTGLFDLHGTVDGSTFFSFVSGSGFTTTLGACPLFPGLKDTRPSVLGIR